MRAPQFFTAKTFSFLKDLAANNEREWFNANKSRFEDDVREPARRLITEFGPHLKKISPHFNADPRPVGGSMFRIYRDVRFSNDKRPYKTHTGIQFRHERAKDAHAPGFYLHIEPGNCFAALGSWHPESVSLKAIREAIVEKPKEWSRAIGGKAFRERFELVGDALKRPPRGFDPEHPLMEDLKRRDFIATGPVTQVELTKAELPEELARMYRLGAPLVRFICHAVGAEF